MMPNKMSMLLKQITINKNTTIVHCNKNTIIGC